MGWQIRAQIGDQAVVTRAPPGQPREVMIDDKPAPQVALGRLMRVIWLVPAMDRLWLEGAGERRRFLDRLTLSFAPGHAEDALAYEKAMRDRNRLLVEGAADRDWLATIGPDTDRWRGMSREDYVETFGSEGAELMMCLVMRGAMNREVRTLHTHYHVPASMTGAGCVVMENA